MEQIEGYAACVGQCLGYTICDEGGVINSVTLESVTLADPIRFCLISFSICNEKARLRIIVRRVS